MVASELTSPEPRSPAYLHLHQITVLSVTITTQPGPDLDISCRL